jgi:hypothetical protein
MEIGYFYFRKEQGVLMTVSGKLEVNLNREKVTV